MNRSSQLLIAILAVLKTGAAYVPLDPSYPKQRLLHMVEDSQLNLLITETGVEEIKADIPTVLLDEQQTKAQIDQQSVDKVSTDLFGTRHLAYVIYTSGSTGLPKGVMVEHQSISDHVQSMCDVLQVSENDHILQLASASFDTFLEQVFAGLISASSLYINEHSLISSEFFYDLVRKHQITLTDVSPAYLGTLVNDSSRSIDFWNSNTLTRLVVGGDVLAQGTVQRWFDLGINGYCRLYNAYGPTEATITATLAEIHSAEQAINIGLPLPGRMVLIADDHLKLVPFQAEGELYIGGKNLARGYLNQSKLTDERFVSNPYSDEFNDRLYKTGDLVRYQKDGSILYLGRVDDQVKIRGYRIELGEIEQQLSLHPSVKNCAVIAIENDGQKQLAAYVSCHSETDNGVAEGIRESDFAKELTRFLADQLPAFMLPQYITLLEQLPVMPNGKLDRNNLPLPELERPSEQMREPPSSDVEIGVCCIWSEILKLPNDVIGLQSNFFELGGDSLKAVKLLTKLKSEFSVNLPIQAIFEFSSLGDLTEHISALLCVTEENNDVDQEVESESFEI